jgi:hypothetical protein
MSIKRTFIFEVSDGPARREIFCPAAFALKPGIRDTANPVDMLLIKSRRSMSATFKKSPLLLFVAQYFYDDSDYLKRAGESRCICRAPAKKPPLRTKKLDGTELPVNNDTDSRNASNLHYTLC